MNANDTQVGGSHYNKHDGEVQHWDWVIASNVPYTLGCATKYLFRWRDKNGIEDLKKARHYIQKTIDIADDIYDINLSSGPIPKYVGGLESMICSIITTNCGPWRFTSNLQAGIDLLDELIRDEESKADTYVYAPIAHRDEESKADTYVYAPIAHREGERLAEIEDQPTASQLHPG